MMLHCFVLSIICATMLTDAQDHSKGFNVGQLSSPDGKIAGNVYIIDCSRLMIENFSLVIDGNPPIHRVEFVAQFRDAAPSDQRDGSGIVLYHQFQTSEHFIKNTTIVDKLLTIENLHSTWTLSLLYLYDFDRKVSYGGLSFPDKVHVPQAYELGYLITDKQELFGEVILTSDRDFIIHGLYLSSTSKSLKTDLERVDNNTQVYIELYANEFFNETVMVKVNVSEIFPEYEGFYASGWYYSICAELIPDFTMSDVVSIAVKDGHELYAKLEIQDLFFFSDLVLPPSKYKARKCYENCPKLKEFLDVTYFYKGSEVGKIVGKNYSASGMVYVAGCETLVLSDFTLIYPPKFTVFMGKWKEGNDTNYAEDGEGFRIPYRTDYYDGLVTYNRTDLVLLLPASVYTNELALLYLWNFEEKQSYGSISFPDALNVPSPNVVGNLVSFYNGLAGRVLIINDRTLYIKQFSFDGKASNTYFYIGKNFPPQNGNGVRVAEQYQYHYSSYEYYESYYNYQNYYETFEQLNAKRKTVSMLRNYTQENVCIMLPGGQTVHDITYLAVYSELLKSTLAYISIYPEHTENLPPYLNRYFGCQLFDSVCTGEVFNYDISDELEAYTEFTTPFYTDWPTHYYNPDFYDFMEVGSNSSKTEAPLMLLLLAVLLLSIF